MMATRHTNYDAQWLISLPKKVKNQRDAPGIVLETHSTLFCRFVSGNFQMEMLTNWFVNVLTFLPHFINSCLMQTPPPTESTLISGTFSFFFVLSWGTVVVRARFRAGRHVH